MKYKYLTYGLISITIALILTVFAAELHNSNPAFVWGIFVTIFVVYGSQQIRDFIYSGGEDEI